MRKGYTLLLFLFLIVLSWTSCNKSEDVKISNEIALSNPKVGQKNKFVSFFLATNSSSSLPVYQKDTMIWEITSISENSFEIKEYLTPNSSSLYDESKVAFADQVFKFTIKKDNSSQKSFIAPDDYRKNSRILNNEDVVFYNYIFKDRKIEWSNWLPIAYEDGQYQGYVSSIVTTSKKYELANVSIDNRNLTTLGIGTYILYDPNELLIRSLTLNHKSGQAFGWEKID